MAKIQQLQTYTEYALLVRRTTRSLWIASGVLFGLYLYFVGAITFSVIEQKGLEESTKILTSDMSTQELVYLEQEKQLTKEFAYSIGLVDAQAYTFTTKKQSVALNGSR